MRSFQIKIAGKKVKEGRIPLNLFKKILEGVQSAIYQIGEYHSGFAGVKQRGAYSKTVVEQCTLELVSMEKGSFVARFELPVEGQISLFPDLGENALQSFFVILESIAKGETTYYDAIKDKKIVHKVLRTIQDFLPRSDDYFLLVSHSSKEICPLTYETSSSLEKILYNPAMYERECVGKVVELRIADNRYLTIFTNDREIKCYFDEELESRLISLMGKEVRIVGEAKLKEDGQIDKVDKVIDVRLVEPGIWTFDKIHWKNRVFYFRNPIEVNIDRQDGQWVLQCKVLSVLLYADDFEELLHDFYEEFSMLWDEYALEADEYLYDDAILLKNQLRELVHQVGEEKWGLEK